MATNFEKAKIDPSSVFARPLDILKDESLTRDQKIDLLRRWAYEERELAVAEEENMLNHDTKHEVFLDEVLKTLLVLGVESDQDSPPPTKQG